MRFRLRWLPILLLLLPLTVPAQQLDQSPTPDAASRDVLVIDELICRGNVATSCDFILGHIYLSPGDSVDENELGNARLRLSSLPSFESVDIYLERGTERGHVRVVVDVVEADPHVREWLAGTSLRLNNASQLLAGRFTNQNLFGTGKLLDATLYAKVPIDGVDRGVYGGRVQYVDPHWLNNKRMYFIAGLSGALDAAEYDNVRDRAAVASFDVSVGRRLFDFSYLTLGYRYDALVDQDISVRSPDGRTQRFNNSDDSYVVSATYGWNSEDDPYFPTRGSRAAVSGYWLSSQGDIKTNRGIRKTWTTRNRTSWLLQAENTPGSEYRDSFFNEHFSYFVGFARPLSGGDEIQRGRWYVEAGYSPQGSGLRAARLEYGLKVGVRLQTRSFGIVDLYVIGSQMHPEAAQ